MESHVDQAIPENSDQVMSNSDEQSGTSQVAAKSYECTFCKRGFSNAQALGGHMNIHRKDKAKLKQLASPNISETKQQQQQQRHQQRPLDIPKLPSSYSPILPFNNSLEPNKPSDIERITRLRAWPCFPNEEGDDHHISPVRHDQNHVVQVQQLPLFSQTPSNQDHHHHHHHQSPERQVQVHGDLSEKGLQPSSHGPSGSELDLELRLGPEPQDSSAPPNTTRKFF